jgi:phosphoesterase family protein
VTDAPQQQLGHAASSPATHHNDIRVHLVGDLANHGSRASIFHTGVIADPGVFQRFAPLRLELVLHFSAPFGIELRRHDASNQLTQDLTGSTPQSSWIGPGLCNDGHDCSAAVADAWLSTVVPEITASSAWKNDGVLYITWDESIAGVANLVPLVVVAPDLHTHTTGAYLDHYALAGTIADQVGIARPGGSTSAGSIAQALRLAGE